MPQPAEREEIERCKVPPAQAQLRQRCRVALDPDTFVLSSPMRASVLDPDDRRVWHFDCCRTTRGLNHVHPSSLAVTADRAISDNMSSKGPLIPEETQLQRVHSDTQRSTAEQVVITRDHELIRRWAQQRQAEPATGEATDSGPATVHVNDGGAGIRFNFPGAAAFRPIGWDEWFENFDHHECAFVYDNDSSMPLSYRYRIVKAKDWLNSLW